jgi:hypothetical protein
MEFYYCLPIVLLPLTFNLIGQTTLWKLSHFAGALFIRQASLKLQEISEAEVHDIFRANNSEMRFITNTC